MKLLQKLIQFINYGNWNDNLVFRMTMEEFFTLTKYE